jgi:hypothetical protein
VTADFEAIRQSPGVLDGNQLQAAGTAATVRMDGGQARVNNGPAVEPGNELDGYVRRVAATGIEAFGNAADAYGKARRALRVIEPYGMPTVEELAARHLARVRRLLPLDDLAAALEAAGYA